MSTFNTSNGLLWIGGCPSSVTKKKKKKENEKKNCTLWHGMLLVEPVYLGQVCSLKGFRVWSL
jgi:hypothetical protein